MPKPTTPPKSDTPSIDLNFNYHPKQSLAFLSHANEILFGGATRGGKAVRLDTPIFTLDGFKTMGEILPGDYVFGPDGEPTIVIHKTKPFIEKCYEVLFDTGEAVVAGASHEWVTENVRERANNARKSCTFRERRRAVRPKRGTGKKPWLAELNAARSYSYLLPDACGIRTTREIYKTLRGRDGRWNHSVKITRPLQVDDANLPIDPYVLGVWLGDGTRGNSSFTGVDVEIAEEIRRRGYSVEKKTGYRWLIRGLITELKSLGIETTKDIPPEYFVSSPKQRLDLLRGLMDTDGSAMSDGQCEFCSKDYHISEAVRFLAASLGCKPRLKPKKVKCQTGKISTAFVVKWTGSLRCFTLKRKLSRLKCSTDAVTSRRFIVGVRELPPSEVACIEVDNESHEYLITRSLIPTHNSFFTRTASIAWSLWIPGLQTFIYRKYYDDVITNHMEGPDGFRALLNDFVKAGQVKITENQIRWSNGSLITLCHCSTDDAVEKAQGVPKHLLIMEEATQILERHIRFIRSWVSMPEAMRDKLPEQLKAYVPWLSPEDIREMFPRIIYTGNPTGVSMGYFRRYFVKAAQKGVIFRAPEREGGFKRQYIEARVEDNPSEDAKLVRARVKGLGDDSMSSALLESNWDAPVGDFFPQYDDEIHTCPNFDPPQHWFKFITFDWGSAEPFAVLWWCVSDGVEFKGPLGQRIWFRRGALIAYREWYGCNPEDSAKGLEMRNEDVARGIIERTREPTSGLVLSDGAPFQDRGMSNPKGGKQKYRISDVFADCKCPLVQGNSARKYGWSQIRSRLIGVRNGAGVPNDPMIFFCEECVHTRDYIPALGRDAGDPEDAQKKGEATHLCDCVRIACATKPIIRDAKKDPKKGYQKKGHTTPKDILRQLQHQSLRRTYERRY